jgi:hypothetical protein
MGRLGELAPGVGHRRLNLHFVFCKPRLNECVQIGGVFNCPSFFLFPNNLESLSNHCSFRRGKSIGLVTMAQRARDRGENLVERSSVSLKSSLGERARERDRCGISRRGERTGRVYSQLA